MPLPANATEAQALDTSGDGQLSPLDSPFAPYYPGDEYVDWVGLSVYYKGPNSQNVNVPQPQGYCYGALRNHNPNNGVDTVDPWYENYCVGRNKACMVSRSLSLVFHSWAAGCMLQYRRMVDWQFTLHTLSVITVRRVWTCLSRYDLR